MKLGELKKSLARMSPDLDDSEVVITTIPEGSGKEDVDLLAYTGYTEIDGKIVVILGSMESACDRLKKGNLHRPDGSKPSEDGFELNG